MIKLVFCLRRLPTLSRRSFSATGSTTTQSWRAVTPTHCGSVATRRATPLATRGLR